MASLNKNSFKKQMNKKTRMDPANFNKPQVSFGLFNHLESPFTQKKINDHNERKIKQKYLQKQQQLEAYKRKNLPTMLTGPLLLSALSSKKAESEYDMEYNYLNQVIPPTRDALHEYTKKTLNLADIPPPFNQVYQNDNIENIFTNKPVPNYTGLSDEEARQALIRHVSDNFCQNKSFAKKMHILRIENSFVYSYTLETYSEKRQTCWAYEPYTGGYVDDPSMGQSPSVWDLIPKNEPKLFVDHVETMVIPHSECIRSCHGCKSNGSKKCQSCHGNGYDKCYACNGEGMKFLSYNRDENYEVCLLCKGNGRRKCWSCNGYGEQKCKICLGSGQLKCFLKLTITWRNHTDEYLPDNCIIPKDKLKFATGDVIFNDTKPRIMPINYTINKDLSFASEKLITKHEQNYLQLEKPIMQRQLIQVKQVATIHYQYRNKLGIFWVFGKESKVFAPNYPKNCCPCCPII